MKYGIKCYTSDEVQERIETIYGEKTVGMNRMHVTKIGSFQVIPFQSPHNGTECDGSDGFMHIPSDIDDEVPFV